MKRPVALFSSVLRVAVDVAFPPQCPSCQREVAANGNFCAACFDQLRLISVPYCHRCGVPFAVAVEKESWCPECLVSPPAFSMARAVMVYDRVSSPLISAMKFHDQWAGIGRYGAMLSGAGNEVLTGADYIVPVPLHWRRLFQRRYNQSALLAYSLSKRSSIVCMPHLLKRMRATTPQMKLDRKTRTRNVKDAFAVPDTAKNTVADKIIVLMDDVITTGATVDACAKALLEAGAKEVRVLALARTVRE